mmetsp:Transcript_53486/g.106426  ORF Transcript_53486/g.106426 Transcript_53486/m.106426 type:complete len:109 (+) Transcript_53486:47-373(+)
MPSFSLTWGVVHLLQDCGGYSEFDSICTYHPHVPISQPAAQTSPPIQLSANFLAHARMYILEVLRVLRPSRLLCLSTSSAPLLRLSTAGGWPPRAKPRTQPSSGSRTE